MSQFSHDKDNIEKQVERYRQGAKKSAMKQALKRDKSIQRPNRTPKKPRRKKWSPADMDEWDELEIERQERIMPRGEQTRRRQVENMLLEKRLDAQDETTQAEELPHPQGAVGQVIEVSSALCRVDVDGETLLCGLRGSLSAEETGFTNVVAVGDKVVVTPDGAGQGVVETVLPRRSALVRPDVFYSHLQQVLVANADQVLIVASWREPLIWLELIDRYLIAAARCKLEAVLCINKIDLVDEQEPLQPVVSTYEALAIPVLLTSARTGVGVDALRDRLCERLTVLTGLSGVGKSSLLSAVQPGLELRTAEISERKNEGRHTTSQSSLLKLDRGGAVVDTPGIREFGMRGLRRAEMGQYFTDLQAFAADCRYRDCSHLSETECGVQAAVQDGRASASRYHSYERIYNELSV